MSVERPILFVTNYAPEFRVGAFAALHSQANVQFALVGGNVRHGGATAPVSPTGFPFLHTSERSIFRLAASGRYRAVIAGLSGRVALPAAYLGARAGRIPFVLWATIWRHPRTGAHTLSYPLLQALYRNSDAVVTYGRHVSEYVRSKAPGQRIFEAPQSNDLEFWSAPASPRRYAPYQVAFAGRIEREKGVQTLLHAWREPANAALVLAGEGAAAAAAAHRSTLGQTLRPQPTTSTDPEPEPAPAQPRVPIFTGRLDRYRLRDLYAGSDVVVIPSIPTRDFLEPWGLVANEAFARGIAVIATTAVGAVAGGLVRDGETGLVVAPSDPDALAAAIARLRNDPALRGRLGAAGHRAVLADHSHADWATGMSRALAAAIDRHTSTGPIT